MNTYIYHRQRGFAVATPDLSPSPFVSEGGEAVATVIAEWSNGTVGRELLSECEVGVKL